MKFRGKNIKWGREKGGKCKRKRRKGKKGIKGKEKEKRGGKRVK